MSHDFIPAIVAALVLVQVWSFLIILRQRRRFREMADVMRRISR